MPCMILTYNLKQKSVKAGARFANFLNEICLEFSQTRHQITNVPINFQLNYHH